MAFVALVTPCYAEALRPADRLAARTVLEALGDDVLEIRGRCCGQPAFNSGFREEARDVGRELLRDARNVDAVVMPSGSCVSMVQHYLPGLWEGARRVSADRIGSTFVEFGTYVSRHPRLPGLRLSLKGTVAYHDSCHNRRELHATAGILGLLDRIEGLEVRRLGNEAECCGFGGTFSVKQPGISDAIRGSKIDDVLATGARVLVSTDASCLGHIAAGARARGAEIETWSITELVRKALA